MPRSLLISSTAFLLLAALNVVPGNASFAQGTTEGAPGVSSGGSTAGSSSGSAGMPDEPAVYERSVRNAAKKGKTSRQYIESLVALGMMYNRLQNYAKAASNLNQALTIVDSGALKPTAAKDRKPDTTVEKQGQGTVSIEITHTPMPYEETLQGLLPQLATAEIGANQLAAAEIHLKRLMKMSTLNPVADKVSLMYAYSQYAEVLRKLHRNKEAAEYQSKADKINSSFIGL